MHTDAIVPKALEEIFVKLISTSVKKLRVKMTRFASTKSAISLAFALGVTLATPAAVLRAPA
jgi:hypothetical protein